MNTWTDSLGIKHNVHEPLLKAGIPAPAEPPPGQFRALVDELAAHRQRRRRMAERVSRADHIRPTPARPAPKPAPAPLRKSLKSLAAEARRMTAQVQRQTEAIQRRTAMQMFSDLNAAARAGKLGAIEAAKLDALAHRHARALGLESTGVRS